MLAQNLKAKKLHTSVEQLLDISDEELLGRERTTVVKQRVNQYAFRSMILNNYDNCCAITSISIPEMLIASHIIPWAENEHERLNPENGICLSALYDRAFDKGFISLDKNYKIIIADKLKKHEHEAFYKIHFSAIEQQTIFLPEYHRPNLLFLEWHRDMIFNK